jgi:hypothetical protein
MPITFHCECCKKKINAPDDAGGKWGKCPYCNHRCYIPLPPSDNEEELGLSPINDNEERQYKQMMHETYNIRQSLLHETAEPADDSPAKDIDIKDLARQIVKYLQLMAAGSLDEAHNIAETIIPHKDAAKDILEKILKAKKIVPQLQDVPKKVIDGFIRNMLERLE